MNDFTYRHFELSLLNFVDEVTTAWLQMMDDVILGYGEPTYSALASALDATGHSTIAARIRDNGGKEGNDNRSVVRMPLGLCGFKVGNLLKFNIFLCYLRGF